MSVDHGQTVQFKIDTDADDYRIDIYRIGYYQGLGARLITTINPNASLANNQPNPLVDYDTGLVDAGNWRVTASWNVPTDAISGVYIAKLTREDGTFGESQIIFVVRDDEGSFGHGVSDVRYNLASLQRLGRQQPLRQHYWPQGPRSR